MAFAGPRIPKRSEKIKPATGDVEALKQLEVRNYIDLFVVTLGLLPIFISSIMESANLVKFHKNEVYQHKTMQAWVSNHFCKT